ncbi:hypothetical protein EDC94DRAFT_648223 [Helicostylum pulchrum]|nr:hypothetical protein EDC94DRAFT_648223 [Helicostylum pulchrum]
MAQETQVNICKDDKHLIFVPILANILKMLSASLGNKNILSFYALNSYQKCKKSIILILISALCLAGTSSVFVAPEDCRGFGSPLLLPDKKGGDSYINCVNGSGDLTKCPKGKTFDHVSSACKYPQDAECFAKAYARAVGPS